MNRGVCVQVGEDESSLVVFEKLFDGAQFRRGYDLTFSSTSSGALAVQIAGKEVMHPGAGSVFFFPKF